jgi:hypothetical protein
MRIETKIAVPYSLMFLMDPQHGQTPENMRGSLIAATTSCVAIGTFPDSEGETKIVLTNERGTKDQPFLLVFDGTIQMPNGEVSVCTALNEALLTLKLETKQCRVNIWVNSTETPDEIEILTEPLFG